jgi:parallel beta-helix repeat protein
MPGSFKSYESGLHRGRPYDGGDAIEYWPDPVEPDQGASGSGNTVKDLAEWIGTTKRAKLVFDCKTDGEDTPYIFLTSWDARAYPNLQFEFKNGAMLEPASGVTNILPSPLNIIARPTQQIFSGAGANNFFRPGTVFPEYWGLDGIGDQAEINLAFASLMAGGIVKLTQALYTITGSILPTAKTTLDISQATTLALAAAANAYMVRIRARDVKVLGGGTIDGNSTNQTAGGTGILIDGAGGKVKIRDLTIQNHWWAGVYTEGQTGAHITDVSIKECEITNCDDNGVRIGNYTDRVQIVRNNIHDNGVHNTLGNRRGISTVQFDNDILISDNDVNDNYENGIYIWTDALGVRIMGNYVSGNQHFGIETQSPGCIISGNHLVGNGGQEIDDGGIFAFSKNIVFGNFVDGNDHHGIYIYSQYNTLIIGNIARDTQHAGAGIRFYDPNNCLCIGNICFDDQAPKTQAFGILVSEVVGMSGTPFIGNLSVGNQYNYIQGANQETPLVGNILSADGYEIGGRDRRTGYAATISDHMTFDPAYYHSMLLNGGAGSRNINPAGIFRLSADIWLKNTGSTHNLVFDSAGLNQALTPGQTGYFMFNGSAWTKMFVG